MKITLFFCVVAVVATSSCLATALPPCVSYCVKKCTDLPCIRGSVSSDAPGTMKYLMAVLCAYNQYMDTGDIVPVTKAVQNLGSLADCTTADILPYLVNGELKGLMQTVFGYVTVFSSTTNVVSTCGPLTPLLAKTSSRLLGGAPIPILGGNKEFPTTVPAADPGVVNGLLDTVKRLLQGVLGNNAGLVGNLLGPVGNILSPAGGYNDKSSKGILDGVTSTVNNLLGVAPTNPKGGSSAAMGIINGLVPSVNDLTQGILSTITGNQKGGSGALTEILNGVLPAVNSVTSTLGSSVGNPIGGSGPGLLNAVGPLVNSVQSSLLGPVVGNPNGGSGPGLLNAVGPIANSVQSSLLGPVVGNPNGGSGSGLLSGVGPIAKSVTTSLLGPIPGNPTGGLSTVLAPTASGSGLFDAVQSVLNVGPGVLKPVLGFDPLSQLPLVGNILSPVSSNDGYSNIRSETTGPVYGNWQPNSDSTLEASLNFGINAGPAAGFQSSWGSSSGNGGLNSNPQVSGTSMDPYSSLFSLTGK